MGDWAKKKTLIDVCARQWAESVNEADKAFENMPESQWHQIKYEDFVTTPKACLLYTSPSPRDATLSRMPSSA